MCRIFRSNQRSSTIGIVEGSYKRECLKVLIRLLRRSKLSCLPVSDIAKRPPY